MAYQQLEEYCQTNELECVFYFKIFNSKRKYYMKVLNKNDDELYKLSVVSGNRNKIEIKDILSKDVLYHFDNTSQHNKYQYSDFLFNFVFIPFRDCNKLFFDTFLNSSNSYSLSKIDQSQIVNNLVRVLNNFYDMNYCITIHVLELFCKFIDNDELFNKDQKIIHSLLILCIRHSRSDLVNILIKYSDTSYYDYNKFIKIQLEEHRESLIEYSDLEKLELLEAADKLDKIDKLKKIQELFDAKSKLE